MAILNYSGALGNLGKADQALSTAQGLQSLRGQRAQQQAFEDQLAREQADRERIDMARMKGAELLQSGSPEQVSQWAAANPDLVSEFQTAAGLGDSMRLKNRANYAKDILTGAVDPVAALTQRIETLDNQGIDTKGLKITLDEYNRTGDPNVIREAAKMDLVMTDNDAFRNWVEATGERQQDKRVTSSKVLADGTTIQSLAGGGTQVIGSDGRVLEGVERTKAIKNALKQEVTQRGEIKQVETDVSVTGAGKKKAVDAAVDFAKQANTDMQPAIDMQSQFDEAIALLDQGADTGVIYDKLPSFTEQALLLDNIRRRAGFNLAKAGGGTITDADIEFGLSTAFPTGLQPEALKDWLIRKRDAQQKIINTLQETVNYLGGGDKTLQDFYKHQASKNKVQTMSDDELLGNF